MDNAETFWQRVKDLIKSQKITQESLASSADVSFNNLKQQIFYKRLPDAAQAVRIAKALNTSVEYLVTGEESDRARTKLKEMKESLVKLADSMQV